MCVCEVDALLFLFWPECASVSPVHYYNYPFLVFKETCYLGRELSAFLSDQVSSQGSDVRLEGESHCYSLLCVRVLLSFYPVCVLETWN